MIDLVFVRIAFIETQMADGRHAQKQALSRSYFNQLPVTPLPRHLEMTKEFNVRYLCESQNLESLS